MILDVKNLHKSFRHPWNLKWIPVLKDVSFEIPQKAIVGFLGSNGAGKTTTIKCIFGINHYQQGSVKFFGKDASQLETRKELGYLPERPYFYNYLTAYEFLKFYGELSLKIYGKELDLKIDELLELVGLTHAKHLFLKNFSKGMLQRVGMAQALVHNPKLLILDEPLSGLDPDGRMQMASVINNVFSEGTTVFFSSHLLDDVDRLCKDLIVIKKGQIQFCGRKDAFVDQKTRSYKVSFLMDNEAFNENVTSLDLLQKKLDELRLKNAEITAVQGETMSLELAFRQSNADLV